MNVFIVIYVKYIFYYVLWFKVLVILVIDLVNYDLKVIVKGL